MLHVMVIDDQSTSRIILEELVGTLSGDLRVHAFGDPRDALDWARAHQPDLVLSDFRMPGLNGAQLTRALRAMPHCADIPVLIVTVMEEKAVKYAALEAGASDLLTKPVDPHECRARCRNLLTLRRQQRLLGARGGGLPHGSDSEADAEAGQGPGWPPPAGPEAASAARGARVAGLLARRLGLAAAEVERLETAAALRDLGMLAVPRRVRDKPGPLSAQERALVRRHVEVLEPLLTLGGSAALALTAQVTRHHHERWDGSGYPDALAGPAIPLPARIVAVADVFAALTALRAHRPAHPVPEAMGLIGAARGSQFDPQCVDALQAVLPEVEAGLAQDGHAEGRRGEAGATAGALS